MLAHYAPPRQLDYQVRALEHEYSEKVVNYPGSLRHLACKLDLVIRCVDVGVGGADRVGNVGVSPGTDPL